MHHIQLHNKTNLINLGNRQPIHNPHMLKPQLGHRLPRLLLPQLSRNFVTDEHKVPAQHLAALCYFVFLGDVVGSGGDVDHQRVFDAEYRIAVLVAVATDVEGAVLACVRFVVVVGRWSLSLSFFFGFMEVKCGLKLT
jgi:hypothetical protein